MKDKSTSDPALEIMHGQHSERLCDMPSIKRSCEASGTRFDAPVDDLSTVKAEESTIDHTIERIEAIKHSPTPSKPNIAPYTSLNNQRNRQQGLYDGNRTLFIAFPHYKGSHSDDYKQMQFRALNVEASSGYSTYRLLAP
ncbi:MAG: hypothetical protein Q9224_007153, partial [Gallowayella concinna]